MRDQEIRETLNQHWTASESGDFATEHDIYQEDAVLDYPQSRERIVGRHNIQITQLSTFGLGIHGIKPMCPRSPCTGDAPKGDLDDHGRRSAIDNPAD